MSIAAVGVNTDRRAHWAQIDSSNPLDRLSAEIKRRTYVVVGAMMFEPCDEWSVNRRDLQLEGLQTLSDAPPDSAARVGSPSTVRLSRFRARRRSA